MTFAIVRSVSLQMSRVNLEQLKSIIRDIPDFPKSGIIFKDITPILGDGQLFQSVIDHLGDEAQKMNPSKIVGIDARGFLFGAAVAYKLGLCDNSIEVHMPGGKLSIEISKQFKSIMSEDCSANFEVIGTTAAGAIVLELNSAKPCSANRRWLVDSAGKKPLPLSPGAPFSPLYNANAAAR